MWKRTLVNVSDVPKEDIYIAIPVTVYSEEHTRTFTKEPARVFSLLTQHPNLVGVEERYYVFLKVFMNTFQWKGDRYTLGNDVYKSFWIVKGLIKPRQQRLDHSNFKREGTKSVIIVKNMWTVNEYRKEANLRISTEVV